MSVPKLLVWIPVMLVMCAAAASAQTLRVNAERTALRDKPSTEGAALATLVNGDELAVLERAGTWYRVRVKSSGAEGYVNGLLVDVLSAPASPGSPATAPPAASAPAGASASVPAPSPGSPSSSQSAPAAGERKYIGRVFGGLVTGYGDTGFAAGGGVGWHPFDNQKMEIAIDGLYARASQTFLDTSFSTSVLAFSGNFLYNFRNASQSITPFAGGGLVITNASVSTDAFGYEDTLVSGNYTALQLVGGIEKPLSDRRAFRAELRTGFASFGGSLVLIAGLSF